MAMLREGAVPVRQRLEHRDPLGADGQAVGGVFDIAAGDDRAVGRFERGADLEMRERGVGVSRARRRGGGHEIDRPRRAIAQAGADRAADRPAAAGRLPSAPGSRCRRSNPVRRSALTPRASVAGQRAASALWPLDAVDDVRDARDLDTAAPSAPAPRCRRGSSSAAATLAQWRTA